MVEGPPEQVAQSEFLGPVVCARPCTERVGDAPRADAVTDLKVFHHYEVLVEAAELFKGFFFKYRANTWHWENWIFLRKLAVVCSVSWLVKWPVQSCLCLATLFAFTLWHHDGARPQSRALHFREHRDEPILE